MNLRAIAEFEKLKSTQLFSNVGVHNAPNATVVSSWSDAISRCSSREWDSWLLEAANQIRDKLSDAFVERYCQWNDITHEIKRIVIPILDQKCEEVITENALPKSFIDTVHWDVLGFFVEVAYSDIASPGFFHSQWESYMNGHFPCGWEGNYPSGRPIIY